MIKKILFFIIFYFVFFSGLSHCITEDIKIKYGDIASLRSIAAKYLGNSDLWPVILKFNGIKNINDIKPDKLIVIPAAYYKQVERKLKKAGESIRKANMNGAGILARDYINESIRLKKEAEKMKRQGNLEKALQLAGLSVKNSQRALAKALKKRKQSVSAILARKKGIVETKKPEESIWKNAKINQELIVKERLRTLERSMGQILFVDGNILNLYEKSMIVIGVMKEDILERASETKIIIVRGDALFYLKTIGNKKAFSVLSPEMETRIRSSNFKTSRDAKKITMISNYDGEIDVKAKGGKVTVKKNEGIRIESGKKPTSPKKLLPPPEIVMPFPSQIYFSDHVRIVWKKVKGALKYGIEISRHPDFTQIAHSVKTQSGSLIWKIKKGGLYFLRIYSIDNEGLEGPFSPVIEFYVNIDLSPPYLAVHTPLNGDVILSDKVIVQGMVEENTSLTINGHKVESGKEGGMFDYELDLLKGTQAIIIEAKDAAGNKTIIKRSVICSPDKGLIKFSGKYPLITNKSPVAIKGTVQPGTLVEIDGKKVNLPPSFTYFLDLPQGENIVRVKAINKAGAIHAVNLKITVDLTPPAIKLDPFPRFTKKNSVKLSGIISEAAFLTINNNPIKINKGGQFKYTVNLKNGENPVFIRVKDTAGNITEKNITIIMDVIPPIISGYTLKRDGAIYTIKVKAKDMGSGLARTGSFIIKADGKEFMGILTLNRGKDLFKGSVFISSPIEGKRIIKKIVIRDLMGNTTRDFIKDMKQWHKN